MARSLVVLVGAAMLAGCPGKATQGPAQITPERAPAMASVRPAASAPATVSTPVAPARTRAPRGLGKRVDELRVVDDARFWLVADGRAWETRDAGQSFVNRTPFVPEPSVPDEPLREEVWSLLATGSQVLVLRGADAGARSMTLFVSEDGGGSFVERSVPRLLGGRDARLERGPVPESVLVLRSDGNGMNSHERSILETRDLGASFLLLGKVTGYGAITFQSSTSWWSVGTCCASASSVYHSSNAGRTWTLAAEENAAWEPLSDVVFTDAKHGSRIVRAVDELALELTADGGRSFQRSALPAGAGPLLGDRKGWVMSREDGELLATRDVGASWTPLPRLPAELAVRSLARAPHSLVAVADLDGATSVLLILRDGARAWEELAPSSWSAPGAKP